MNIARYISELLFDYECVVIPGLGGFITNVKPAGINSVNHQFNPPYTQVFFNVHLTTNDGLLINHIQKRIGKPYAEIRQFVDQFVDECFKTLESGDSVLLENVGTLSFNENKNIRFEQIESVNYNANAFGLNSFISPAIKRQSDENKIIGLIIPEKSRTSKPIDRKPLHQRQVKKKRFVKSPLIIALAAILVISISWGFLNRDNVSEYIGEQASLFSFLRTQQQYHPRTENTLENDLGEIVEEVNISEEFDSQGEVKEKQESDLEIKTEVHSTTSEEIEDNPNKAEPTLVKSNPVVEPIAKKEDKIIPAVKPTKRLYYIIAGSFSKEVNAGKLVDQLKNKGFDAVIADTNKNGMFRVAYLSAGSLDLAKEKLYAIREEDNAEAWILRK